MTIDRRKFEWNLNTILQIITIVLTAIGGVTIWVNKSRDIEDLQNWRTSHEQIHRERLADAKEQEGKHSERLRSIEEESKKIDQMEYRLTVVEQSTAATNTALKELNASLADMKGDIKVILQRLDTLPGRK